MNPLTRPLISSPRFGHGPMCGCGDDHPSDVHPSAPDSDLTLKAPTEAPKDQVDIQQPSKKPAVTPATPPKKNWFQAIGTWLWELWTGFFADLKRLFPRK